MSGAYERHEVARRSVKLAYAIVFHPLWNGPPSQTPCKVSDTINSHSVKKPVGAIVHMRIFDSKQLHVQYGNCNEEN